MHGDHRVDGAEHQAVYDLLGENGDALDLAPGGRSLPSIRTPPCRSWPHASLRRSMAGKRGKSPRSAPRAGPNVGTSAKDRKGIFAPHLIIPAAHLVRLSFGPAQSRQWFALHPVYVVHGFARAFPPRLR